MSTPLWDRIVADVHRAYGLPGSPSRSFAREEEKRQPYRDLVAELASVVTVTDDTDPDDVCLHLLLGPPGAEDYWWILSLSYVGRYAMFYGSGGRPFTGEDPGSLSEERQILELLDAHGVTALSGEILARHFPLPGVHFYAPPQEVRLYQVLFADRESLPFQRR